MKCPFCAETIQDEAKKCRFCGETITNAAKAGFPEFYINTTEMGLMPYSLASDYGMHVEKRAFGDNGSMLAYGDWFRALWNYSGETDFDADTRRESQLFRKAILERLRQYVVGAEETRALNMILKLLSLCEQLMTAKAHSNHSEYPRILSDLLPLRSEVAAMNPAVQKHWNEMVEGGVVVLEQAISEPPPLPAAPPPAPSTQPTCNPQNPAHATSSRSGCLNLILVGAFSISLYAMLRATF